MGCYWIRRDLGLHAAQVNVRLAPVADQIHPTFGTSTRTFVGECSRVGFVKEVREGPRCLGGRLKICGKMPLLGPYHPGADAIQVMTLKVSKGLEFPVVALPGIGHMPAPGEDEKEAARVFYVRPRGLLISF